MGRAAFADQPLDDLFATDIYVDQDQVRPPVADRRDEQDSEPAGSAPNLVCQGACVPQLPDVQPFATLLKGHIAALACGVAPEVLAVAVRYCGSADLRDLARTNLQENLGWLAIFDRYHLLRLPIGIVAACCARAESFADAQAALIAAD